MQSSLILQRGLVAALSGDSALRTRGLNIYDGPPTGVRLPYLSVGLDVVHDRGWKDGNGLEHRFQVIVWNSWDALAASKDILADVERIVLAMPRQIGALRLVSLRMLRASVRRGPRDFTQGIVEFRAFSVWEN